MINGEITEFVDKLYYGEELLFEYDGKEYFLQGWKNPSDATMVLDIQDDKPFEDYLWKSIRPSIRECAEEFLNSKLWGGKTFMEIQREVTWKE